MHMGTGPVGVRGRFGKGGTSLQNKQGSGSGGRSVELVSSYESLLKGNISGEIEIEVCFSTLTSFFWLIGRFVHPNVIYSV